MYPEQPIPSTSDQHKKHGDSSKYAAHMSLNFDRWIVETMGKTHREYLVTGATQINIPAGFEDLEDVCVSVNTSICV